MRDEGWPAAAVAHAPTRLTRDVGFLVSMKRTRWSGYCSSPFPPLWSDRHTNLILIYSELVLDNVAGPLYTNVEYFSMSLVLHKPNGHKRLQR